MAIETKVDKNTVIGEAIKLGPKVKEIIKRHFGDGCFTCPGINMESIGFGCMMHNMDADKIVAEINEELDKG